MTHLLLYLMVHRGDDQSRFSTDGSTRGEVPKKSHEQGDSDSLASHDHGQYCLVTELMTVGEKRPLGKGVVVQTIFKVEGSICHKESSRKNYIARVEFPSWEYSISSHRKQAKFSQK